MNEPRGQEQQGGADYRSRDRAIGPGRDGAAGLRYLASFAGMITRLTGRFVTIGPEGLDDEINQALREIGEFAAVDRSYVFQFSADGARVSTTHEWCAPGIEPAIANIQDTPVEQFEWAMSRIKRGEVLYIERVQDLPPDAATVRAELERQGVQSLINLPLICADKVLGFVGFDSVRHVQSWNEEHIKLLKVVGEIIAGAIERNRATLALRRQVELETLVTRISTRFINVPVSSLDREIDCAIGEIGCFTGVDRSYLFQFQEGGSTMSNTHEWCAVGIEPHIERLQGCAVDAFGYCIAQMRRGEVFYVADVRQLPDEASAERAEFEVEGIKTLISFPIMLRGEMSGFIGFDAVRTRKTWSEDDIRLLKLVAEIFANALDRSRTERQLQASLREKEVLLREIHHRVKNNMQVIASLLYLQAHASREQMGPVAQEAFSKSQSRIKSMAAVHDRLYRSGDLSRIDFREYLDALVADLLASYSAGERMTVEIESDALHLSIDQAIPCGLMVNELFTNCVKHAFPDGRHGRIVISVRQLADGSRMLSVVDDGVGMPETTTGQRSGSMGLRLVQDLAHQLGGEVSIESNGGTRVQVKFPESAA